MQNKLTTAMAVLAAAAALSLSSFPGTVPAHEGAAPQERKAAQFASAVLEAKFDYLAKNGNSNCTESFMASIASMADGERLRGSCCSPMSLHRYREQIEGLRKLKSAAARDVADIPDDPYDVEARLAKRLLPHYEMNLSPEEQARYDYAMKNSNEKGPCCCYCWRWQVYGGSRSSSFAPTASRASRMPRHGISPTAAAASTIM